ncbi:MAG: 4Fe-4S dicluster domain-containing protein [Candidatus Syntropharchaeia archaeon]
MILEKDKLIDFLKALPYKVFVPQKSDDIVTFGELDGEIKMDKKPVVPPKKILFPQTDPLFRYRTEDGIEIEPEIDTEEKVIFGVRPCDARSFVILDSLFKKDYEDPYYIKRREKTILIGLTCTAPWVNCFCTSVGGSPSSKEGLDVLFTDLGDRYYVEAVTERGKKLLDSDLLKEAGKEDENEKEAIHRKAEELIRRKMDEEGIKRLETAFESKIWEEIARKCIKCGICTYLCPTCHCFDIQDEARETSGRRVRIWDSCMFPEYSLEASGHNPRPTRAYRMRNRVFHKFKWYPENFGVVACVGCGRCIDKCPVNIDIIDIMSRVSE